MIRRSLDQLDSEAIVNNGNQTIAGVKTFSSSPIVPVPTLPTHPMNAGNATLTGGQYFTYGGTANAITLTAVAGTSAPTAYVTGMMVRFRATAANTGATTINVSGLGVKTVNNIINGACPSGYIRTGIDTVAVYDGTDFIAHREIESGSNANGGFVKYADGGLVCTKLSITNTLVTAISDKFGSTSGTLYAGSTNFNTFPHAFISNPVVTANTSKYGEDATRIIQPDCTNISATACLLRVYGLENGAVVEYEYTAIGKWY